MSWWRNSGEKGRQQNRRLAVGSRVRRAIAERSPPEATRNEHEAIGDRPATRLGTAENPRHDEGQSVSAYAATGGLPTRWHSYLVTYAAPARLSRPATAGPRRLPAPLRPVGLIDSGAGDTHGELPWHRTPLPQLASRCARAGGTTGPEKHVRQKHYPFDSTLKRPIPTLQSRGSRH